MRLEQLLFQAGYGSRRRVKRLLYAKKVTVNGNIVMNGSLNTDPQIQDVRVSDEKILLPGHQYFILNKPQGVVTAVTDPHYPTVLDLFDPKDISPGLYPVGRLDRDTQGLLLLTDNGPLGFHMLHPRYHVMKRYEVQVNGELTKWDVDEMRKGIRFLDGTQCAPAILLIRSASPLLSSAMIAIQEGKLHQVKKMFLCLGKKVTYLNRIQFGPFCLEEELEVGKYRALTTEEKNQLVPYFR